MTCLVPEHIETARLILRPFREEDWQDLHHYYSYAEATTFTVGQPLSEGETWRTLCGMIGHWSLRGYGPYAVEEKASGVVVGTVGFWYPNDWPGPEIKWALAPAYWGRGLASEAARAVHRVGLSHLPDIALISFIHAQNVASIRLARAIGASLKREVEFRGANWHIYEHAKVPQ
ncbi:GNAT family N-acetyltransferase [Zobellella sp. An-6]|uniref:GNAT family N-acetyltransferase n=1 Tax=Zobellella sp. An-6 TaxID=3400218 RepID=UPI0040431C94